MWSLVLPFYFQFCLLHLDFHCTATMYSQCHNGITLKIVATQWIPIYLFMYAYIQWNCSVRDMDKLFSLLLRDKDCITLGTKTKVSLNIECPTMLTCFYLDFSGIQYLMKGLSWEFTIAKGSCKWEPPLCHAYINSFLVQKFPYYTIPQCFKPLPVLFAKQVSLAQSSITPRFRRAKYDSVVNNPTKSCTIPPIVLS